jgi:MipA family protein
MKTLQVGFIPLAVALVIACNVGLARAGDGSSDTALDPSSQTTSDWDVALGLVVLDRPTYQGSDRSVASVGPSGSIVWRDTVALNSEGLKFSWHVDGLRIGVGVTYDAGRTDSNNHGFFSTGDDRLAGLREIHGAVGFDGFAAYRIGPVSFDASGTKFDGGDNKGALVNFGLSEPFNPIPQLTITPRVGAVWANTRYMETFFGVTAAEAADSTFRQFTAEQGVLNITAGIGALYRLNEHWRIGGGFNVLRFEDDAAKSPLTLDRINRQVVAGFGYHF